MSQRRPRGVSDVERMSAGDRAWLGPRGDRCERCGMLFTGRVYAFGSADQDEVQLCRPCVVESVGPETVAELDASIAACRGRGDRLD